MKMGWVVVLVPLLSVIAITLAERQHEARAASRQAESTAQTAAVSPARISPIPASDAASATFTIPDTTIAVNSDKPMSERIVHYEIDAHYDAATHAVNANETLTYHNLTGQSLDHFPFHLYQNAFQPNSTFVREAKLAGTSDLAYDTWEEKEFGSETIKTIDVVGQGDVTQQMQYIQPDDGNKDDKTVIDVRLPKPIAPGAYVQFRVAFETKFPETQARSGWKHDFVLGGQWFPKVGVWWHGAWNCHQYHALTEFFADFGVYDVKLTVPENEVVGASGVRVEEVSNPDRTKTYTYHGDDIHDFAWTASPRYKVKEDGIYQGQMGPVQMRILMQPAHWGQVGRHEKILRESLDYFERWYGPYPYKTITLVDPEDAAAGGMEYPTFITGGTDWFMPERLYLPEVVIEHEFGHQYWYGMVATNEFEDAWMDEGINSYTEVKVLDSILGKDTSIMNLAGVTVGEREEQRRTYAETADADPIAQKAYDYYSGDSYAGITYGKTASVLLTVEGIIGEDTMQKAMRAYFMKYRFTHPTKDDFLKTIEDVSSRDLKWYFSQAIDGSQLLDYKIPRIESFPVNWYEGGKNIEEDKNTVYRSYVWVQRKGDFEMPVEIEVKFSDGSKVREHWDGASRWTKFMYEKKAKVDSAELDPDHKIQIDRNDFNNSWTREPHTAATYKMGNYWLFASQWAAQAFAWWGI
jgi:Peptidase family M1 domain